MERSLFVSINESKSSATCALTFYQYYSLDHCCRNYINHCPLNYHCTEISRRCSMMMLYWPSFGNRTNVDSLSFQIQGFRWKTLFSLLNSIYFTQKWLLQSLENKKKTKYALLSIVHFSTFQHTNNDCNDSDQLWQVRTVWLFNYIWKYPTKQIPFLLSNICRNQINYIFLYIIWTKVNCEW